MTHQPANRPRIAATYALRHGARPPLARRRRRARLPSAAWLDGPRRPDRSASSRPRLAARRVVDHRNQGISSCTGPKPCRLGAGGNLGAAVAAPGFTAQLWPAPSPPSGQAAMGPRTRALVREIHEAAVAAHRAANDSTEPRRNGRGWCGYAPACCGRLHESVPSPTLAVRCLYVTKDGSPTRRPASLLWSFHTTPQYVAVSCGRGALALSSGH